MTVELENSGKRVHVGVVGLSSAGWAAATHLPALLTPTASPHLRITALSTTSAASAQAAAAHVSSVSKHPVKGYASAEELAADADVDVVAVSVKAPAHEAAVERVLQAPGLGRKDLFLEWPAGGDVETARRLCEAMKGRGGGSVVGLQGRFSPIVTKVKEIIDSGKLGKIRSTLFSGVVPRELEMWGPVLSEKGLYTLDPAIAHKTSLLTIPLGHALDTLLYTLSLSLTSISATTQTAYPTATVVSPTTHSPTGQTVTYSPQHADHIAFSATSTSGVLVSVLYRSGCKARSGARTLLWEVDGEDGVLRVEGAALDSGMVNVAATSALALTVNGEAVAVEDVDGEGGARVRNVARLWAEYARSRGSSREGEGRYARLEDAVRLHRVLDAIRVSAGEGRRVDL